MQMHADAVLMELIEKPRVCPKRDPVNQVIAGKNIKHKFAKWTFAQAGGEGRHLEAIGTWVDEEEELEHLSREE